MTGDRLAVHARARRGLQYVIWDLSSVIQTLVGRKPRRACGQAILITRVRAGFEPFLGAVFGGPRA